MDHNFEFAPESGTPASGYTFPATSTHPVPPPSSSSSSVSGSTASFLSRNPSHLLATRPKFTTVLRGASYNKGKQPAVTALERSSYSSRDEQGRPFGLEGASSNPQNRPSTSSSSQTTSSSSFPRPHLSRRGSHPLSVRSKVQQETADAEFIKRAFDNLSIEPQTDAYHGEGSAPVGTRDADRTMTKGESDFTLIEMLENDDPLGVGVSIRRVSKANPSKTSLASSLSPPASALSYLERASAASTKSLLPTNNNGHASSHSGHTPTSTYQPRHSESSYAWSDPFDDGRRLRRRSTISGYSVSSADWNSLRRGSLASLAGEYPASHSRSASIAPGGPGDILPGDTAGSLRWEAWATAYRDSVLNRLEPVPEPGDYPSQNTNMYGSHLAPPLRPIRARTSRLSSMTSDFNAGAHSIQEHVNLFYPLRRQFLAKHGSRSERNRILIIELCHALEEYSREMVNLWDQSQVDVSSNAGDTDPSDMSDVELVANEVDSLVREIIEAVPAFSYALGQGNYGPLPFSIHNLTASTPGLRGRAYLIQVQAVPDAAETDPDILLAPPEASWWPTRLRADLNEGLLTETGEDSPALSIMQTTALGAHPAVGQVDVGRTEPERNDVLLEEGRRRWLEYKEARKR